MAIPSQALTPWARFWHQPVRAERLALMRILLGLSLLTDQLFQYLPNLEEFFGPTGVAPRGLHDWYQLAVWRNWSCPAGANTAGGRRGPGGTAPRSTTCSTTSP